jgi:hypothetical protein
MTTPQPASGKKRTPLSWAILVVAMTIGAYVLVTAFEGYDDDAPICASAALTAGAENIPKSCKFPVIQVMLGRREGVQALLCFRIAARDGLEPQEVAQIDSAVGVAITRDHFRGQPRQVARENRAVAPCLGGKRELLNEQKAEKTLVSLRAA